ncbi:mucin-17-like isoform X2 [Ambystoma mexicanum]|uniref:mucin-17-like isoform X2 n=1 Tax=Ambystoma mexicanum TaxID=8296 RepID=UPI0037E986B4
MSEAGAEVQPAEAPSMAEESSTEEETSMSDPSVSAFLTKQLCKHGGRLPLSDIPQHLDLTPEHIASILREEGKRFPQPEPGTVFAQSPIRLCGGYLGGKCESTQCERLHLCRYFILGRCFIGRNRHGKFCKFSHHIRSIENRAVLKTHEISNLNEKELRVLLQLNDPYCLPEVCREYQGHKNATCPKGNECHRLHVCQYFARGQCRYYRCNRSHDLLDPDAIKVLNVRGLSDEMINNVQLLRIHQCNEARKEPGKQEQPKRWKSKGEDISVACHDMHQSDTCDVQELGDRSPSPSNAGGTKSARSAPQRRGKPHLGNSGRPRFTKAASVYPKAKYHDEVQPIETREEQKSGTPTIPPSSSSTAAPRTRIRQTDNQGIKKSVDPGENTPTMNTLKYAKDELFGQKPPVSWTQWADKLDEIMSVSSPPSIKTMDAKCPSTQSTNNVDVQASMRSPPPLTANNMMSNRTTPKADGQPTNKPVVPTLLDDSPTLPTFNKCKSPGLFGSSEDDVKPPAHTLVDSSPMPRSKKCTAAAPLAISPGDSEQVVRASVERSPPMPTYKSCFATTTFATEDNTKHDIRTSVDASTSNSAVQTLVGASPSLTTYTKDTTAGLRTCSIGDTKRAAGTSPPIPTVYNTNPGEVTHIGTASSMQASAKRPATPIPTVYNTNPGEVTHIGTASSMQASAKHPATPIPTVYNTNPGAVTHIGTASSMQASAKRPATPIPTVYNTNPGAVTHIGTASSMQASVNHPATPIPTVYNTNTGAVTHIGTASSMQASVKRPATPIPIVYNTNTGAVTHIGTASSMQASVNRPATPIPTVYNTNPGAVTHIGTASSMQASTNRPASPTPTNKIRFIPNRPHSVTIQPANRPNGPSTVGLSPTSPSTTFTANPGIASQTRRDEGHFVPHHAPHWRVNEIYSFEMEDISPPLPRRNVSRSHVPPVRSPRENRGDPNEICFNNLWKFCKDQQNCPQMHYYLPYRWQRQKGAGEWEDLPWMEDIEKAYSDPDNTSSGKHDINFEKMISCYLPIRRLSTASSVTQPPDHLMTTEWVWHWKNELGKWIEYGKHGSVSGGQAMRVERDLKPGRMCVEKLLYTMLKERMAVKAPHMLKYLLIPTLRHERICKSAICIGDICTTIKMPAGDESGYVFQYDVGSLYLCPRTVLQQRVDERYAGYFALKVMFYMPLNYLNV